MLWIVASILVNPIGNFPVNDDWTYGLAVERILKDGTFALPSGSTANVLIQAYWGALFCLPFGFSYTALRISTLVVALFGIWAAYGTARELGGRRSLALLVAGSVAAAPLFLPLAATFMTDVPFSALIGMAFYCFTRGMRRSDRVYTILGFAVGLASILLRQFGLIFVIAFGMAMVAQSRGSFRSILILVGTTILGLAMHLGFQHWMMATHRMTIVVIGSAADFGPGLNPKLMGIAIAKLLVLASYVGVMLLPIYCATGFATSLSFIRKHRITGTIIILLSLAGQFAAAWNRQMHFPDYGNDLSRYGLGPMLIYDRSILGINLPVQPFPSWAWLLLFMAGTITVAAIIVDLVAATARVAGHVLRRRPDRDVWADAATLTSIGLYGLLVCMISVRPAAYDRYMLVFMVPTMLLLLTRAAPLANVKWRFIFAWALIFLFGLFSIVATRDHLAWQRARLQATDDLARMGVRPSRIDGGYEYNGNLFYDIRGGGDWNPPFKRSWWWVQDDEYVIGSGPVPHYSIIRSYPFRRMLSRSWDRVVILHRLPGSRGEVDNFKPGAND